MTTEVDWLAAELHRYVAQGDDVGVSVTDAMGRQAPDGPGARDDAVPG